MTNERDPIEDNIPELSGKLEGSLNAPDPAAIHTGLQERQGFRRRVLTGAAGVFAVVALVGAVFAFTGDDDITTTETAADDIDTALVSDEPQDLPTQAVAEDSAPAEVDMVAAVVTINAACTNESSIFVNGQRWIGGDFPPEWGEQETVLVTVTIEGTTLVATDTKGRSAQASLDNGQPRSLICIQPSDTVQIPAVAGLDFDEALDRLFEVDLRTSRIDEASTSVPSGVVLRTAPPAGTSFGIAERPVVTIFVSSGPPRETIASPKLVEVPNLVELSADEAVQRLETFGFVAVMTEVDSNIAGPGIVIAQDPSPGSAVRPGTLVYLEVSLGPSERLIPDLAGLSVVDALNELFELDFRTVRVDETNPDFDPDTVIRTEPPAGALLRGREIVTIIVSSGPTRTTQVAVTNVESTLVDAAAQQLRAEGFEVYIDYEVIDDPSLLNIVLRQTPSPETLADPGSAVTIVAGIEPLDG